MKNVLKNHVAVLMDTSGSMDGLMDKVKTVFDNQIKYLRESSIRFEQETRISVYTFDTTVECLISDVDVARPMELPKLSAGGSTSMLDAMGLSIEDLQLLPQKYGDHAFIVYLITDGEENTSRKYSAKTFKNLLDRLPQNFSILGFTPNNNGVRELKSYGIPEGNIDKWDATERGVEEIGTKFQASMNNYFTGRSQGVRVFNTMISDLGNLTEKDAKQILDEVKGFKLLSNADVKAVEIRDLVESQSNIIYTKGCAFYELVKNEKVQASKTIAIQNKKTGKVYSGANARKLLNLPNAEVKITPQHSKDWVVYIQSTSVNRKVIPKQRVLVI